MDRSIEIIIQEYAELDRFPNTTKDGWHRLDEATLRLFGRGDSDGSIWFESDKMREWLTDFGPESMSDLVLLRTLYYPGRIGLFPEFLRRKLNSDEIPSAGNAVANRILRDTYGILVYQEQALMLQAVGFAVDKPFKDLALKGHEIARTMLSVEALWLRRFKTSLQ
jgi:DNA polymerase-3 subunit alpha